MADNIDSTSSNIEYSGNNEIVHGSMIVEGNLQVDTQLTANYLRVPNAFKASSGNITFSSACEFVDGARFNNSRTIIGIETTFNSAYVGTETLQAGKRLVIGDSAMKITASPNEIIADTFNMSLRKLTVDNEFSRKTTTDLLSAKDARVTHELIAQNIFADTIKTNNFYIENLTGMNIKSTQEMTVKDLIVGGFAKVQNDITIMGVGVNGAALTVNGGHIVANKGIISNTRNNKFQTLQITGSGKNHDVCFQIDKNVDSFIEGDVTIQDAKLILDNSKLVSDEILVTPLEYVDEDEVNGVQITTNPNWNTYKESMVEKVNDTEGTSSNADEYDPYAAVEEAQERTQSNYESIQETVKELVNPISYALENSNPNVPGGFRIKNGLHRIDHNGNALFKNVVAENAEFSTLKAYDFKTNKLTVDKLTLTSVASNVVETDNLLKSTGIAEIDGTMNVNADVFVEEESKVNVADGAKVTFQSGSSLVLKNGANFTMGSDTQVKMSGDIELDLNKLTFFDSKTGRKYKIAFREASEGEGYPGSTVMEYWKMDDSETTSTEDIAEETEANARELDDKLKKLGL